MASAADQRKSHFGIGAKQPAVAVPVIRGAFIMAMPWAAVAWVNGLGGGLLEFVGFVVHEGHFPWLPCGSACSGLATLIAKPRTRGEPSAALDARCRYQRLATLRAEARTCGHGSEAAGAGAGTWR